MTSRASKVPSLKVALLFVFVVIASGHIAIAAVSEDNKLPLAQLQSLGNPATHSAEFRGKPMLLQFWASWCHSCSSIMFDLDKLLVQYPNTDYLAVSLDDERDDALQYIEKHALYKKYNDQYFIDSDKLLSTTLGIETVPTVILLDANGNEVVRRSGHLNGTDLLHLSTGMKSITENRITEDHSGENEK
jgi:thiol-disulfide isomerase/thioredoxin